jgi:hypothetical protein
VEKGTESRGSARYGKGRLLVLKNVRREAILPGSDLLAKSLAQERWSHRPAVEQDGINARATLEEVGKMSSDRAVGGIGKPPFPQRCLRPVRPRPRITPGKEPVQ